MSESKGTPEDCEDEKEDATDIMARSLNEAKVTKATCDSSVTAAVPHVEALMSQLDGYSSWAVMEEGSSMGMESVEAYSRGKKDFRLALQLHTDDAARAGSFLFDLEKRTKWDSVKWNTIKKDGEGQDVVQLLYPQSGVKSKYIEYVLYRTMRVDPDDHSVLIVERSLMLPPRSDAPEVRRVHINACVKKLTEKIDIDAQKYVECQVLMTVDEGFAVTAEYGKYTRKEIEADVATLNKLLEMQ